MGLGSELSQQARLWDAFLTPHPPTHQNLSPGPDSGWGSGSGSLMARPERESSKEKIRKQGLHPLEPGICLWM